MDADTSEVHRSKFKPNRGTGDKGQSSLFTGEKRWKDDAIFEALGTTDELSCTIGIARELAEQDGLFSISELLENVQCTIQDIGSVLATPSSSAHAAHLKRTAFDSSTVDEIDRSIDRFAEELPPLRTFILPGGGELSARLHLARAVCRRAERRMVEVQRSSESMSESAVLCVKYVNRLSDLLFVLARYACFEQGKTELQYKAKTKTAVSTKEEK